ncbi:MAG: DUF2066 domain-containing protein [Plesiomonas sp.]
MQIRNLLAGGLLLFTVGAQAAEMGDFYQVRIPVSSDQISDAERVQALDDMLIRFSGLRTLPATPALRTAQQQVQRYISQSNIRNENGARTVDISFDQGGIQQLAHELALPQWSSNRPTLMLWLVDNQSGNGNVAQRIMQDQEYSAAREQIRVAAMARGISVLLPLGDLDDNMAVTPSDVQGYFIKPIAQGSERYQPDAVLVATLNTDSLTWRLYDGKPETLLTAMPEAPAHTLTGAPDQTVAEMIQQIADIYAQKSGDALGAGAAPAVVKSGSLAQAYAAQDSSVLPDTSTTSAHAVDSVQTQPQASAAPVPASTVSAMVAEQTGVAGETAAASVSTPIAAAPVSAPLSAAASAPAMVAITGPEGQLANGASVAADTSAAAFAPQGDAIAVVPDVATVGGYAGTAKTTTPSVPTPSAILPSMNYPSTPLAENQYAVVVAGITTPDQLVNTGKALAQIKAFGDVQMIGLAGSEVEYHVQLKGALTDAERELAASGSFKMDSGNTTQGKVLKYQWGS